MLKIIKNKKAAALVETAIMVPLLVMIIFGFISYTQVIKDSLVMQTAAREGARRYAVYHDAGKAISTAYAELAAGKVSGATVIPLASGQDRGVRVEKDVIIKIPFTEIQVFTLKNEVWIRQAADMSRIY